MEQLMHGTYNDNIAYHFHSKLSFEKPVFFQGCDGVLILPTGRWGFSWSGVKERGKDCGNGCNQKCDTIVEKVNANFGARGFFRIIDVIQIPFLRLN